MPLTQVFPVPQSNADESLVGKPHKVDFIAIHGLNSGKKSRTDHAWDTWRSDGDLWLEKDLPKHAPGSRIFIYEYNASVLDGNDRTSLIDKANNLLETIRCEREDEEKQPIIFLCHGMGALLVKQALVNARNNPNYLPIESLTSSLMLFATRPSEMNDLEKDSVVSGILQEHWKHLLHQYDIISFCGAFGENNLKRVAESIEDVYKKALEKHE